MTNVKNALTRKLGPLPAWVWILLFGIGVWYYRRRLGGSTVVSGTGTGSVAPAPTEPQPQTTLEPGESVYDPNTGALTTAPGGGSSDGTNTDPSSAIDNLANAIAGAIAAGTQGGQDGVSGNGDTHQPATAGKPGKHRGKRKPKDKPKPKLRDKLPKRKRGNATTKHSGSHRRLGGRGGKVVKSRTPTGGHHAPTRSRPRIGATRPVLRQRPQAATQPAHHPSGGAPVHRPSAPPPRTHRARHRRH